MRYVRPSSGVGRVGVGGGGCAVVGDVLWWETVVGVWGRLEWVGGGGGKGGKL